jgi:ribose transport system permease protein
VIGSAMMKVIDNGINMFQVRYQDADGVPRLWRLDANWTFIIVGSVILIAVVLDQVVHVVQAKRRLRPVEAPAAATPSLPAV